MTLIKHLDHLCGIKRTFDDDVRLWHPHLNANLIFPENCFVHALTEVVKFVLIINLLLT